MPLGMSTNTVGSPIGTVGMYGPASPMVKFVPLSVFFLNLQGEDEEDEENGLYGKKKASKGGKSKKGNKLPGVKGGDRAVSEPSQGGKEGSAATKKQPPGKPERPSAGGPEPPKSESIIEGKIKQPQKCKYCDSDATKAYVWADGRAYIPVCDSHEKTAKRRIEKTNRDKVSAIRPIPQKGQSTAVEQVPVTPPVLTPVKAGATRASSGAMGTGNIARYHVPLGPPLRRVTPIGDEEKKRKRRKKKLKTEDRDRWIERLSGMIK